MDAPTSRNKAEKSNRQTAQDMAVFKLPLNNVGVPVEAQEVLDLHEQHPDTQCIDIGRSGNNKNKPGTGEFARHWQGRTGCTYSPSS